MLPTTGGGGGSVADLIWKAAGGLAGLAVLGALFIVFRTRRRQSAARAAEAEGAEEPKVSHKWRTLGESPLRKRALTQRRNPRARRAQQEQVGTPEVAEGPAGRA